MKFAENVKKRTRVSSSAVYFLSPDISMCDYSSGP